MLRQRRQVGLDVPIEVPPKAEKVLRQRRLVVLDFCTGVAPIAESEVLLDTSIYHGFLYWSPPEC